MRLVLGVLFALALLASASPALAAPVESPEPQWAWSYSYGWYGAAPLAYADYAVFAYPVLPAYRYVWDAYRVPTTIVYSTPASTAWRRCFGGVCVLR